MNSYWKAYNYLNYLSYIGIFDIILCNVFVFLLLELLISYNCVKTNSYAQIKKIY